MKIDKKHSNLTGQRDNEIQKKLFFNGNIEHLSEDDIDIFVNNAQITNGIQSSRHNGTHELVPNLIAQQENKFATITSQNNLVVYESSSNSKLDSQ